MAHYFALTHFMPGGERDDLAQQARLGVFDAIHAWDSRRRVPFRSFAWLCAVRETRMAASAARAGKHEPLNGARSLHRVAGEDGHALEDTLAGNRGARRGSGREGVGSGTTARDPRARSHAHRPRMPRACPVGQRHQPPRMRSKAGRGGEGGQQRPAARPAQGALAGHGVTGVESTIVRGAGRPGEPARASPCGATTSGPSSRPSASSCRRRPGGRSSCCSGCDRAAGWSRRPTRAPCGRRRSRPRRA